MKLLVSDYDQTLSMDDITIKFNINKINEFRKNGNLFMISTGRNYESISKEIKKYNIEYDYLSCSDGATLYSSENKPIFASKLNYEDNKIVDYLKLKYKNKINIINTNSDGDKLPEEKVIEIKDSNYKEIIKDIKQYFERYLNNSNYFIWHRRIYITPKNINKSTTINYLEEKLNISKSEIFTIGDHNNDFEMIKDYNGFTMLWGTKKAKQYALKQYMIMSNLITDIEKNSEKFVKKLRFK